MSRNEPSIGVALVVQRVCSWGHVSIAVERGYLGRMVDVGDVVVVVWAGRINRMLLLI